MVLLFILIAVWVLVETLMFLIQKENVAASDEEPKTEFQADSDSDETTSHNLNNNNGSTRRDSSNERDSGLNVTTSSEEFEADMDMMHGLNFSKNLSKRALDKAKKAAYEKRKQMALAKRLARQERDLKDLKDYLRSKQQQTYNDYDKNNKSGDADANDGDDPSAAADAEDGYETDSDTTNADMLNTLYDFVQHIRYHKIVAIEDLAKQFNLKIPQTIGQIQDLQKIGTLSGVIDDRGKFIYVSESELMAVTKFIQQQRLYSWPQTALI